MNSQPPLEQSSESSYRNLQGFAESYLQGFSVSAMKAMKATKALSAMRAIRAVKATRAMQSYDGYVSYEGNAAMRALGLRGYGAMVL
jgi:hypothetical protein